MSAKGNVFKTVLVGEGGVGKTSLAVRYTEDRFDDSMKMTIGVNFASKRVVVDGKDVRLLLWDLGGQPRFQDVVTGYFVGAKLGIAVYSVPSPLTLLKLENWITRLHESVPACDLFVVGNKMDERESGSVMTEEARHFAESYGAPLFEVSARTGEGVQLLFDSVARFLASKYLQ